MTLSKRKDSVTARYIPLCVRSAKKESQPEQMKESQPETLGFINLKMKRMTGERKAEAPCSDPTGIRRITQEGPPSGGIWLMT